MAVGGGGDGAVRVSIDTRAQENKRGGGGRSATPGSAGAGGPATHSSKNLAGTTNVQVPARSRVVRFSSLLAARSGLLLPMRVSCDRSSSQAADLLCVVAAGTDADQLCDSDWRPRR